VAGRRVLSGLDVTPASDRVTAERERLKGGPVNWGQRAVLSSHVARIKRLRSLTLPPEQPSDGGGEACAVSGGRCSSAVGNGRTTSASALTSSLAGSKEEF
jgi:hypothetical protein